MDPPKVSRYGPEEDSSEASAVVTNLVGPLTPPMFITGMGVTELSQISPATQPSSLQISF